MAITNIKGFFLSMVKSIIIEKNQMTYLLTNNNNKKLQGILYQPVLGYKSPVQYFVLCAKRVAAI